MPFATTSFRRPVQIIREAPGTYTGGVWSSGALSQMAIMATIQPAKLTDYDQMQAEHGGQRLERMIRVYSDTELRIADPRSASGSTLQAGDVVLYTPGRYRVVGQAIWVGGMTLDHYRYLAVLELAA